MLQEHMLNLRKQVELAFAQKSNQLTSVMKYKKVTVRTTKRVEKWFILRNAFRLKRFKWSKSRCRWRGKKVELLLKKENYDTRDTSVQNQVSNILTLSDSMTYHI